MTLLNCRDLKDHNYKHILVIQHKEIIKHECRRKVEVNVTGHNMSHQVFWMLNYILKSPISFGRI